MTNPTSPPTNNDELREQLAAIEHERWADWQKWMHKVLREANPSPEIGDILERWDRQVETPYAELSDAEKASDMEQVDRYWPLITQHTEKAVRVGKAEQIKIVVVQLELWGTPLNKKQISNLQKMLDDITDKEKL